MSGAKINLDKYYTPSDLANKLIEETYRVVDKTNITEIIEPSAGNGAFSNQIKGCVAYDISPDGVGIIKQDFLELKIPHKRGRLIIGNPPFGNRMSMAQKFFKKSVEIAD